MSVALAATMVISAAAFGGYGLVELPFGDRASSHRERALRASAGLLLGLGLISSAFMGAVMAGAGRTAAAGASGILAALAGTVGLLRRSAGGTSAPAPRFDGAPRLLGVAFAVACCVAALAIAEHSLRNPDGGWDAWMIWNLRARLLFRGPVRSAFPPEIVASHPDYPLLLPGLVVGGWTLVGTDAALFPAVVGWLSAVLCTAVLTASVACVRGLAAGFLAGLLLLSTPMFVQVASDQTADLLVAAYVLVAYALAVLARTRGRERLLALAGAAMSMAAWTKNEGLLFTVTLGAALLFSPNSCPRKARDRVREAALFAAGALPVLALVVGFKLALAPPNDMFLHDTFTAKLARLVDPQRYVTMVLLVARRLVYFQKWTLLLVASVLAWVAFIRGREVPAALRVPGRAFALALVGFAGVYLVTPLDLRWHITYSADRLLFQCWPTALFLLFTALRPLKANGPIVDHNGGSAERILAPSARPPAHSRARAPRYPSFSPPPSR